MSVAAAKIIVFLALLLEILSFELVVVILDSLLIIFEAIVAVANMEDEILVQFE